MRAPPETAGPKIARGLERAIEVGECLEWQGAFGCNHTTPVVKVRKPGQGYSDNVPVCRELWDAAYGPVPDGMLVYRTCCNNACVCLEHLNAGTRKQWHANRKRNGKTKHGQATKLKMTAAARRRATVVNSIEKAREVRNLRDDGLKQEEIAQATGVSVAMVSEICCGYAWRETVGNPFSALLG